MATAELAVAMPAVVLVLAVVLGAVSLGLDEVRCVDAARAGARAAARGDSAAAVRVEAGRAAPAGARVVVRTAGSRVTVTVTGGPHRVLSLTPSATAESMLEVAPGAQAR